MFGMSIITTNDDRSYQTASRIKTAGAVLAGCGAYTATCLAQSSLAQYVPDKISKISQSCDNATLNKGIDEAFDNFKLKTKDVKIKGVNENTRIDNPFENLPKWLQRQLSPIVDTKEGKNAFYAPLAKEIYINKEKIGALAFHEMGHAVNHNFSKFGKVLQQLRFPCMTLGGLFGTVALLKRKKVEGEEPNGILDKTTTFIKNNVGKLTFGIFVPIVAEELMATYRGNKMAKKVLSPEMFKKIQLANKFGAVSYVTTALAMPLAAVAASKVRDAIAKPKEIVD